MRVGRIACRPGLARDLPGIGLAGLRLAREDPVRSGDHRRMSRGDDPASRIEDRRRIGLSDSLLLDQRFEMLDPHDHRDELRHDAVADHGCVHPDDPAAGNPADHETGHDRLPRRRDGRDDRRARNGRHRPAGLGARIHAVAAVELGKAHRNVADVDDGPRLGGEGRVVAGIDRRRGRERAGGGRHLGEFAVDAFAQVIACELADRGEARALALHVAGCRDGRQNHQRHRQRQREQGERIDKGTRPSGTDHPDSPLLHALRYGRELDHQWLPDG